MDTFEDELERRLDNLADGVDADGDERVFRRVDEVRTWRHGRRRNAAALGAGIAAVAVTVVALNATGVVGGTDDTAADGSGRAQAAQHQSDVPARGDDAINLSPAVGEPCPYAKHAKTLARLHTGTRRWSPEPGAVPGTALEDAWTCGDMPVGLFGDIEVSYESGWQHDPVPKTWRQLADEWGGHVGTALGRPAWIAPAEHGESPNHLVMVIVDGVAITALADGDDASIGKVTRLVNSIQLPPSLRR